MYTITVLPIAITRWMSFTGRQIPWAGTVFSDVVFASSGFLNVLLFTATRPNLLPQRSNPLLRTRSMPPMMPMSHSRDNSAEMNPAHVHDTILDIDRTVSTDSMSPETRLHSLKQPSTNRFVPCPRAHGYAWLTAHS